MDVPMSTSQITVVAHLIAKTGKEQALVDAVTAIVPAVLREDGCMRYSAHVSVERPAALVLYEVWRDQAALDAHAAGPKFRGLAARFDDLLAEPLSLEKLRRVA